MSGVIPVKVRHERSKMLRILSEKKRHAFYSSQIGKSAKVLFEQEEKGEFMYGFTENYVKVRFPYDPLLVNEVVDVVIGEFGPDQTMECDIKIEKPLEHAV